MDWGKGDAVELLRAELPGDAIALVCGDDTTDEDAFRVLDGDDIGILVGPPRSSRGTYRTNSPA
ncbi:MAG: trehalose-phosphatase, partial [Cyanobacteriota bacterium]